MLNGWGKLVNVCLKIDTKCLINFVLQYIDKMKLPEKVQEFFYLLFLHDINSNCRDYTVCTSANCSGLNENKVRSILFEETVCIYKLTEFSSLSVNPYYIIDVFNSYQGGLDFDNQYLEIERGKHEQFLQKSLTMFI